LRDDFSTVIVLQTVSISVKLQYCVEHVIVHPMFYASHVYCAPGVA